MAANPYAAPRAEVKDLVAAPVSRPVLVWVITIFTAFGTIIGTAVTIASLAGHPLGGPEQQVSKAEDLFGLVIMALSAIAAVELFRLRRRALALFVAVLILTILNTGYSFAFDLQFREAFEAAAVWAVVISWGVHAAIIGYVWWLRSDGVLR